MDEITSRDEEKAREQAAEKARKEEVDRKRDEEKAREQAAEKARKEERERQKDRDQATEKGRKQGTAEERARAKQKGGSGILIVFALVVLIIIAVCHCLVLGQRNKYRCDTRNCITVYNQLFGFFPGRPDRCLW